MGRRISAKRCAPVPLAMRGVFAVICCCFLASGTLSLDDNAPEQTHIVYGPAGTVIVAWATPRKPTTDQVSWGLHPSSLDHITPGTPRHFRQPINDTVCKPIITPACLKHYATCHGCVDEWFSSAQLSPLAPSTRYYYSINNS